MSIPIDRTVVPRVWAVFLLALTVFLPELSCLRAQEIVPAHDQHAIERKIASLEADVDRLETSTSAAAAGGMVSVLFGAFCALWAQNTNRSAWLWFFFGFFLSVIAVVVLLIKNSGDRRPPSPRMFSEGRKIGQG